MHDSNCVKSQLSIMTANSRGATTLHINPVQIRALALVCAETTDHQIQLSRGATALLTHFLNLKLRHMENLKKYNEIFTEVFGVKPEALDASFCKENVAAWDSVHQLNLVTLAEETFDVMLDPEDILGFTSYEAGKEILRRQDVEL